MPRLSRRKQREQESKTMTTIESEPQEAPEFPPEMLAPGANPPEVRARVPFAMTEPYYVPKERYFDQEFFELENKHLWPKSWLMAARLEEIPRPGDYTEFEVAGNSILVIRQQDRSVKALHNACRHRATELAKGCGRLPGGQIVCPFHGWRWNLDGSSSFVFVDSSFDPATMKADDLRLRECKVEIWAGMVWINMDPGAPPLSEALAPAQGILDAIGVGNMRVKWWKQVILNANWKMTMEAFLEGYHVMQTHPQLLMGRGEDYAAMQTEMTEYTSFRGGHGRFRSSSYSGTKDMRKWERSDWDLEDFIESNRLLAVGQDAMALDRDIQIFEGLRNKIEPDDPDFAAKAIQALYEYAEGAGIPMAPPSEHTRQWGGEIFLFPNYFMLPMYSNSLCYRMRPYNNDPEWCLFDVWSLTTYPEGQEPEQAELMGVFDKDDIEHWGLIPRQDFSNIERQQRGLHSHSFEKLRLSPIFEKTITNLHEELDRVIAQ
jgi:phenylpropionate dioxygenase-like ring-hydroxylating dioxygenase large terminal subunit